MIGFFELEKSLSCITSWDKKGYKNQIIQGRSMSIFQIFQSSTPLQ